MYKDLHCRVADVSAAWNTLAVAVALLAANGAPLAEPKAALPCLAHVGSTKKGRKKEKSIMRENN